LRRSAAMSEREEDELADTLRTMALPLEAAVIS